MKLPDTIEHREIASLRPFPTNSRTHSPAQIQKIADSIREFGFTKPVLVRGDFIIAGHGAVEGARSLGMERVPCISLDHLTAEQARAYVIADNRIAEESEWDDGLLAAELAALQNLDFDLSLTGMDFEEIAKLLQGDGSESEGSTDEGNESSPGDKVPMLSFGKYKLELTPEELEDMTARVEAHVDAYGSYRGFVARLLLALSGQNSQLPS
ncbi:ParB/Srx family N-terminal domain-containing protein [Verrucomicrobium sp. BvORR106]|uniref:ParB/Srx family N-terminal domain-containing protein n=1 Tax=Verrucomicrobium sp. BvORR106 TaxID=1403819 RepID=UPI00068CB7F5|nr:ParB/Srx family N-terminal domain-containing protein [Verrucomicrobium sp. BvORR106]